MKQHISLTRGSPVELLRAFDTHAEGIRAAARRKIEAGALEADESVVLRQADFCDPTSALSHGPARPRILPVEAPP